MSFSKRNVPLLSKCMYIKLEWPAFQLACSVHSTPVHYIHVHVLFAYLWISVCVCVLLLKMHACMINVNFITGKKRRIKTSPSIISLSRSFSFSLSFSFIPHAWHKKIVAEPLIKTSTDQHHHILTSDSAVSVSFFFFFGLELLSILYVRVGKWHDNVWQFAERAEWCSQRLHLDGLCSSSTRVTSRNKAMDQQARGIVSARHSLLCLTIAKHHFSQLSLPFGFTLAKW